MRIQNSIKLPLICREFHSNGPFRNLPFLSTFTSHRSIKLPLLFLRTSLHLLHILPVSRHIVAVKVRPGNFTNSIKLIQHPPSLQIILLSLIILNPAIRLYRLPSSYYNCIFTSFSLSSLESLPFFIFRLPTLLF